MNSNTGQWNSSQQSSNKKKERKKWRLLKGLVRWHQADKHLHYGTLGLPGGSDGKESACSVGDLGSIPGLWRSPGGGHGNPLQYSCLESPHGQRSLVGYSPRGCKELDTTGQISTAREERKSAENFPNLGTKTHSDPGSLESSKQTSKGPIPRHIIIKLLKVKIQEDFNKSRRKQGGTYKGTTRRLSASFSAETLQVRREWHDIFKMLKENTSRQEHSAKLSFRV